MHLKTFINAASATALIAAAPVAQARQSQASSAKSLSLSNAPGARASTQTSRQGNELVGGLGTALAVFGSLAAFLVFLETVGAIDVIGDDDDAPDSA